MYIYISREPFYDRFPSVDRWSKGNALFVCMTAVTGGINLFNHDDGMTNFDC